MKIINIGEPMLDYIQKRVGCRGIDVRNDEILISYEKKLDFYVIPGGGLESGETLEECVQRELLEETGFCVKPVREIVVINEYYDDFAYENHYFLCEITGKKRPNLTDEERDNGLVAKWLKISDFISIIGKYSDFEQTDEIRAGLYFREYSAMKEYLKNGDL